MKIYDVKIDNAEETLKNVLDTLHQRWLDCQAAYRTDSEVDAGGNSYSAFEAGGFFRDVLEEIQELLPEEIVFDLSIPEAEDFEIN